MKYLKLALLTIASIALISCDKDDDSYGSIDAPEENQDIPRIDIVSDNELGQILVDQDGRTLYFFSKDVAGDPQCNGGCLESWPAFDAENIELGSGLLEDQFDRVTLVDGGQILRFNGWPLYHFSGDNNAGETNGEGIGNNWFVAKPDYTIMIGEQSIDGETKRYLTDQFGNSLYTFANDAPNQSNCTEGCLNNWPVFFTSAVTVPSTLESAKFNNNIHPEAGDQLLFSNAPLYFFAGDQSRAELNGQGVGNVWFIIEENQF